MENLLVFLKLIGVFGPVVGYAILIRRVVTTIGTFNQESCGYFLLGALLACIIHVEQLLLVANLTTMPFYTSGLLGGTVISALVFAWLLYALLRNDFSQGLHVSLHRLIM
jgi:mannose/fructose/N-acetylgalactosamine-specific phosphotransferase system component IIC